MYCSKVECFSIKALISVNSTYSGVKKFFQSAELQVGHTTVWKDV